MSLSERLKTARIDAGLSQKELAEKLEMPLRTYGSYERGERDISTAILLNICKTLNISSDYLLGRESWDKESERFEEEFNDREEKLRAIIADYLNDPKDRETAVEIIRQFPRLSSEGLDKLKDRIEELVKLGY
jgi:transcriptional regulator with XRE-family HTH domain